MTTVSVWQTPQPLPQREADVVVIGAGLLGCTAAYFLRQAGRQVLIVDAGALGMGASSRNAGFLLTGLDKYYHQAEAVYGEQTTHEVWQLSRRSLAFWQEIAQAAGLPYAMRGSLLLAETPAEARELAQAARRMEAVGLDCEYLPHDPFGRGFAALLRQPGDGEIQPYALVQALFQASGAELLPNSAVFHLEGDADTLRVYSQQALIHARAGLLCVNGVAARLHPYFKGRVMPVRAQCLASSPLPEPLLPGVGYADYGYMYFRDLPDGGFLLGGGRKAHTAQENDTAEDKITGAVQGLLEAYLRLHFPEVLEQASISRRWAGIMGFTPDGLPLVGTVPGLPRLAFALGLNGHGLSLGMAVAERAVGHLLEGGDAGIFDAARLEKGQGQFSSR